MRVGELYELLKDGIQRRCVGPDGLHYAAFTPPHNRRDLWLIRINRRTGKWATGNHAKTRRANLRPEKSADYDWEKAERRFAEALVFLG